MDRLKTYVEGFDEALGGGIPHGSLVLVAGTPGTMKTALTFSILYENVKAGSKALYITLEESQEDLRAAMTDLGMTGLDDMELYILDVGRIRLEHKDEEPTKNWLDVLQKYIDQRVRVNTFDLIALDSLAALYSLSHLNNPRRELFHFFGFLKSLHATCFLISEVPSGNHGKLSSYEEEFLADGILYLGQVEKGAADVQLRLRWGKMRRARHERGYYALSRNDGRFQITRATSEAGLLEELEERLGVLPRELLVAERLRRRGFVLLDPLARLHQPLHDALPGPPREQGGDRRASARHHDEPADRKMQDVRTFRPPFGFPADHLGDLGLVEVRGLAGLREDLAAFPQDDERERVRLLVARGELGPERGLEGESPQPPPEGRHRRPVLAPHEFLQRRLDLFRLPRMEEVPERLELLAQGVQLRRGTGPRRGHRRRHLAGRVVRRLVARRQGGNLLLDQVDGLCPALVAAAQHRFHDDLAMALEPPAEQLQGCVIPLGHPFSPGERDGGYKSIPSEIGF